MPDQAPEKQTSVKPDQATTPNAPTSVEHTPPEDHYASGGQQEEQRQVLKKSVKQEQNDAPVEESAGLHRTGSYTGTAGGEGKSGQS